MISIFGLMKQMLALFCLKIPKLELCGRILLKKIRFSKVLLKLEVSLRVSDLDLEMAKEC